MMPRAILFPLPAQWTDAVAPGLKETAVPPETATESGLPGAKDRLCAPPASVDSAASGSNARPSGRHRLLLSP